MLVFLSRRVQLWVLFALGVPLLAWLMSFIGERVEARTGPNALTRSSKKVGGWLGRRARGPLAPHSESERT